jgi:hypothetical protein
MAFLLDTFARSVFKRMLGKGHTSASRDVANEPFSSGFTLSAQTMWLKKIMPVPGDSANAGIVSALVTLNLEPISGTANTGKYASYRCKLGSTVPESLVGKLNRQTDAAYAPNDYVGDIIPQSFGDGFRPKLFKGAVETPPLDASDWFIDTYSGIVCQEEDSPSSMIDYSTTGTIQCYIYVGQLVSEAISAAFPTFYGSQTVGSGVTGDINGVNRDFTLDAIPQAGSIQVFLNGILTTDWTLVGKVVTMGPTSTPQSDGFVDELVINYRS